MGGFEYKMGLDFDIKNELFFKGLIDRFFRKLILLCLIVNQNKNAKIVILIIIIIVYMSPERSKSRRYRII